MSRLTKAQFVNLAEGMNLDGTEVVIQHNNGKHVSGIDVTFSAYKSVSTLLTIVSDKERAAIQAAWDDCVLAAFERMEATAKLARRVSKKPSEAGERATKTQGSTTELVPAHLIGFVARHHTARPTAETESRGAPPDPHLHTHIYLFNQAWVPDESHPDGGKQRAIDDWGIKVQAEQREHELQGEFARRLEAMGYRLRYSTDRRGRVSWEVEGITDQAISFFSSNARRATELKVDFEAKNFRPPSEAEVRNLMRSSQLKKDHAGEAEPNWAAIGEAASLAGVEIGTVVRHSPAEHGSYRQRSAELRNRLEAPTGLCRDDAVFDRNAVRASVARCAVGLGFTLRELDDFSADFIENKLVLVRRADNPEHAYWTTKANLDCEQTIAATLDSKASAVLPAPSPAAIERAIGDLSHKQGIELDKEQRALVGAVCSTQGLVNVDGWAGTGKTTALKAVVSAFRDRQSTGRPTADQIVAISTASDTAQRTGRKLETDAWHSVEAFCSAVGKGRLRPTERTLLLIDEAVMVDTPRMAGLLVVNSVNVRRFLG